MSDTTQDTQDYDYQRYAVLFVDDEEKIRKYFRRLYGDIFRIYEASDGVEALKVFNEHAEEIGVVVTDQRMPNETGVEFLAKIADRHPDVIKILSTAYSDLDAAIGSVNKGGIYRYITKPWEVSEFEVTLRRAMEFYVVRHERNHLMAAKMGALGNVLYGSRLAAFVLVPVAAGVELKRVAEGVAALVRMAVFDTSATGERGPLDADIASWHKVHGREVELTSKLEEKIKAGLPGGSLAERAKALGEALGAAGAEGVEVAEDGDVVKLTATSDPLPDILAEILGFSDSDKGAAAVGVLAAVLDVYDGGGVLTRSRGSRALEIDCREGKERKEAAPGAEVARWLFDDDLLISSALGLL